MHALAFTKLAKNINQFADKTHSAVPVWALYEYIERLTGMTLCDRERNLISKCTKERLLRKRQYFLQDGEVCRYLGFVVKGAVRMFSTNGRGQESILSFGMESSWIGDHVSFRMMSVSSYHIEALESTQLLMLSHEQLGFLTEEISAFAAMMRVLETQHLQEAQKRIHATLSMSAEERYQNLTQTHPHYTQRFSQNMIACYLGIKPETLSRIRKGGR